MDDVKSVHSAFSQHYKQNKHLYSDELYSQDTASNSAAALDINSDCGSGAAVQDNVIVAGHVDSAEAEQPETGDYAQNAESGIIIAINYQDDMLGFAYYDDHDDHLHILAQDLACGPSSVATMLQIGIF